MLWYKIALSFAMEDQKIVERVYHYLKAEKLSVFYAPAPECQAILSGKNQREIFYEIFGMSTEYVALFVSKDYVRKEVPMEEAGIALAKHGERGTVIPIYLDDTPLPANLFNSQETNYFKSNNPAEIANHLAAKMKSADVVCSDMSSNFNSKKTMNVKNNYAEKQVFIQSLNGGITL